MTATVFFADANEFAVLTNVFKVAGVPADPDTVTVTVTDPTGAAATPTPTRTGTGTYTATVAVTMAGVWSYLWEGTGAASDAIAGTFTGNGTDLTRMYATPEELKSRIGQGGTNDDFEILLACQGASREVDNICDRYFWRGTDTRTYVPDAPGKTKIDDLVSVTTLKIDRDADGVYEESWVQGTDYKLTPYNPAAGGIPWPYTGLRVTGGSQLPASVPGQRDDVIQVAGVFGWPSVPADVKQATLIAATELLKMKDAPFGIAGISDLGVMQIRGNQMIMRLLNGYIREMPIAA